MGNDTTTEIENMKTLLQTLTNWKIEAPHLLVKAHDVAKKIKASGADWDGFIFAVSMVRLSQIMNDPNVKQAFEHASEAYGALPDASK